jgi:hypothetical protein
LSSVIALRVNPPASTKAFRLMVITPALQKFLDFYFSSITLISATHRGNEADLF